MAATTAPRIKVSLYSAGLLNHTTFNQGDHCIIADGQRLEDQGNHTTMRPGELENDECSGSKFGADHQVKAHIEKWLQGVGMKSDDLKKVTP